MKRRPDDLRSIMARDRHLQQLLKQAGNFHLLTDRVRELLPSTLSHHVSAAVGRDQLLILFTDSPAWATRLRFTAPGLRAALGGFREVQVRVSPSPGLPPPEKNGGKQKVHLSRKAAEQIRLVAEAISDLRLRHTLSRLADHGDDKEY
jgi:hypothetical protein